MKPSGTSWYLLDLRQRLEQSGGVLRVGRVVLAAAVPHHQRPPGHGVEHRFIQGLRDERMRQLPQIVFKNTWGSKRTRDKRREREREEMEVKDNRS